jgi:hypothetical protein
MIGKLLGFFAQKTDDNVWTRPLPPTFPEPEDLKRCPVCHNHESLLYKSGRVQYNTCGESWIMDSQIVCGCGFKGPIGYCTARERSIRWNQEVDRQNCQLKGDLYWI